MNNTAIRQPLWMNILLYAVLIIASVIVLFPIYSTVNISLLSESELATYPPKLFPSGFHVENFARALEQAPLDRYLINSILQSGLVMVEQLFTAALAAYAFAFIDFK